MGRHSLLILFIFIGASVQLAEQQMMERIYNGRASSALEYPFIATTRGRNFGHSCGASIINANTAVSAAHCYVPYYVVVGATTIDDDGYRYPVQWFKRHDDYDRKNHLLNDISLVRIVGEFSFGPSVMPIELSTATFYPPGTEAIILGWGYMRKSNNYPLQVATTRVMDEEECRFRFYTPWPSLGPRICAKGDEKQSTCGGDSGGPLVIDNQLAGITSMGYGCNSGRGALYTNVGHYVDWIIHNVAMEDPIYAIKPKNYR